jgi:hypothetical protein
VGVARTFERLPQSLMNQDPPSSSDEASGEVADQPGPSGATGRSQRPPPPPPEAIAEPPESSTTDYAASAAMVKDILAVGPVDEPEGAIQGNPMTASDQGESAAPPPPPPEGPKGPDFFTSARPKKRFRRSK